MNYSQQLAVVEGLFIPSETETRMDCPFCHNRNTLIINTTNNALSWYCFHASCSAKGNKRKEKDRPHKKRNVDWNDPAQVAKYMKKYAKENKKELVNTMLEIDLKKQKMDLLDKNIYQYKTVDIDDLNEEIKKFTKKNENLENEINILTKKWTYAQSILKKPTLEIESLLEEKYRLYDLISKAESYKNRLNYAHTKKEKHEIHEECYSKLKNRSPGNFILKTKNDIRDIKIDITQKEKEINGIIKNKLNS